MFFFSFRSKEYFRKNEVVVWGAGFPVKHNYQSKRAATEFTCQHSPTTIIRAKTKQIPKDD